MIAVVAVFVFIGVPVVGLVLWNWHQVALERNALRDLTRPLQDVRTNARGGWVAGKLDAIAVTAKLARRGPENREKWLEIDFELPKLPLDLDIRPMSRTEREYARKELVANVGVGDAEFDRAFVVEAAPTDVAQALLKDETLRAALLALRPRASQVRVRYHGDDATLRIERRGWRGGQALAVVGSLFADALPKAFTEANRALEVEGGTPYRPAVDVRAVREAEDKRRLELERIAETHRLRREHERRARRTKALAIAGIGCFLYVALRLIPLFV